MGIMMLQKEAVRAQVMALLTAGEIGQKEAGLRLALLHGYSNTLINIDILINVFHKHDIYQSLSISMQQRLSG
jgi:hypothetical protein